MTAADPIQTKTASSRRLIIGGFFYLADLFGDVLF
jgi:hypothetical protein